MIDQLRACNETLDWLISKRIDMAFAVTDDKKEEVDSLRDDLDELECEIEELREEAKERQELAEREEAQAAQQIAVTRAKAQAQAQAQLSLSSMDAVLDAFTSVLAPLREKLLNKPGAQRTDGEHRVATHLEEHYKSEQRTGTASMLNSILGVMVQEECPAAFTSSEIVKLQQMIEVVVGRPGIVPAPMTAVEVFVEALGKSSKPLYLLSRAELLATFSKGVTQAAAEEYASTHFQGVLHRIEVSLASRQVE